MAEDGSDQKEVVSSSQAGERVGLISTTLVTSLSPEYNESKGIANESEEYQARQDVDIHDTQGGWEVSWTVIISHCGGGGVDT